MADLTVRYTLATPGGTIIFNDGDLHTLTDLFWIQDIPGLGGAQARTPIDNVPQGHGGIVHDFWKGPRHVTMEGVILIQSVPIGAACQTARNVMEEALRVATDSILQATGTLSWTPLGQSARSLTVNRTVELDCSPAENYALSTFTFGLVAANPDW